MSTFKEYIAPHVEDFYDFVLLRDQAISERQTVLVPIKFSHIPVSQVLNQQTQSEPAMPVYQPDESDDFLSMVHVALKLRSDIIAQPSHQGLNVCKEDAIAYVQDSLYMYIRFMMGGQSLLEKGLNDCDDDDKVDDSGITDHDGRDNDDDDNDNDDDDDEAEGDPDAITLLKTKKKNSRVNEKMLA